MCSKQRHAADEKRKGHVVQQYSGYIVLFNCGSVLFHFQ